MPNPINLRFEELTMTESLGSPGSPGSHGSRHSRHSRHSRPSKLRAGAKSDTPKSAKGSFWKRQAQKFKADFRVSGTFYNMTVASLLTFIGVFLILVIFRVPFVMTSPKPTLEDPDPVPCISWVSALIWSFVMAGVVFAISFFTRPKAAPAYVLEK
jgi:hypothetical protein